MVSRLPLLLALPLIAACAPMAPSGDARAPLSGQPVEGALFVAGKFGNTLARIDLATGRETARPPDILGRFAL